MKRQEPRKKGRALLGRVLNFFAGFLDVFARAFHGLTTRQGKGAENEAEEEDPLND